MSSRGLAVITGASAGIGAATARSLHRAGHPVLLLARRRDALVALGLDRAVLADVDIRDDDATRNAIAGAVSRYGEVEVLVNNAGVMPLGDVATQDLGEWRTAFEVNLMGAVSMTRHVLSSMVARQGGTIVFITSLGAHQTFPHHAAYCASKAALHAVVDATRLEAGPAGVRVVEVAPGVVGTGLIEGTTSAELRSTYREQLHHYINPEAVAAAVEWICSLPAEVAVRELQLAHTRQA